MKKPCPFCGSTPVVTVQRAPCLSFEHGKGKCGVSVLVQCESDHCEIHPATSMTSFYLPGVRNSKKPWEQEASAAYKALKKNSVQKMLRLWNRRAA